MDSLYIIKCKRDALKQTATSRNELTMPCKIESINGDQEQFLWDCWSRSMLFYARLWVCFRTFFHTYALIQLWSRGKVGKKSLHSCRAPVVCLIVCFHFQNKALDSMTDVVLMTISRPVMITTFVEQYIVPEINCNKQYYYHFQTILCHWWLTII